MRGRIDSLLPASRILLSFSCSLCLCGQFLISDACVSDARSRHHRAGHRLADWRGPRGGLGRDRRRGGAACGRLPQLASAGWLAPFGGEVVDFDPKELIQPRKSIKVMSPRDSARLRRRRDGLAGRRAGRGHDRPRAVRRDRRGRAVVLRARRAAAFRSSSGSSRRTSTSTAGRAQAMGEMYPLWMLKYLPNMPACHIGIRYDARGPNNTIAEGECRRCWRWPRRPT